MKKLLFLSCSFILSILVSCEDVKNNNELTYCYDSVQYDQIKVYTNEGEIKDISKYPQYYLDSDTIKKYFAEESFMNELVQNNEKCQNTVVFDSIIVNESKAEIFIKNTMLNGTIYNNRAGYKTIEQKKINKYHSFSSVSRNIGLLSSSFYFTEAIEGKDDQKYITEMDCYHIKINNEKLTYPILRYISVGKNNFKETKNNIFNNSIIDELEKGDTLIVQSANVILLRK